MLSILVPAVLTFFRTEVQNHREETEHWFRTYFTDEQLEACKKKIYEFQTFVITGLMPFSATPHLSFPPFLVEYITEFHQDVMIDWTNQINEDRIYLPENHNFLDTQTAFARRS